MGHISRFHSADCPIPLIYLWCRQNAQAVPAQRTLLLCKLPTYPVRVRHQNSREGDRPNPQTPRHLNNLNVIPSTSYSHRDSNSRMDQTAPVLHTFLFYYGKGENATFSTTATSKIYPKITQYKTGLFQNLKKKKGKKKNNLYMSF